MDRQLTITFRKDLQGLRAIAILLVVMAHLHLSVFEGGFIGVDVFFVLSGYLITGLLLKEFYAKNNISFLRFYARRLRRLLPSLLFMIVTVFITATLLLSTYELIPKTKSIVYATTWTSNLYFAFSVVDYFSEMELQDMFLHTWSLAVEEQFYLVWPFIIFLVLSVFLKMALQKNVQLKFLLLIFSILFLTSFIVSIYWSYNRPLWAFYLMPSRIWQFSLGAIVLVFSEIVASKVSTIGRDEIKNILPLQLIGVVLIFISSIFIKPNQIYPGWLALAPSVGAALVLLKSNQLRILSNSVLVWIGDRSYSWYLWHWPIFILAYAYGIGETTSEILFLIILSLIIASFSYSFVEIPFWKGKLSQISTSRSISTSMISMLLIVSVTLLVKIEQYEKLEQMKLASNPITSQPLDFPVIYSHDCDSWYKSSNVKYCTYGDNSYEKTVVLIGDSILAQWFSLVSEIFKAPNWRLVVVTKSSCPMVDEEFIYERIGKVYEVCSNWREKVLDDLPRLNPDIIVVGSSSTYSFTDEQWLEGSRRVVAKLSEISDNVLIIPGTPFLPFDGPSCLMRAYEKEANLTSIISKEMCTTTSINNRVLKVSELLQDVSSKFKNVNILALNEYVCPNNKCSALTNDGVVVFRDRQHLRDTFVRSLATDVSTQIKSIGIKIN